MEGLSESDDIVLEPRNQSCGSCFCISLMEEINAGAR